MTYREAMLLLVDKTPQAMEAVKVLRLLDRGTQTAEQRAVKLIRTALKNPAGLSDEEQAALRELAPTEAPAQRTEVIRFRCTEQERAIIQLLAERHTAGNVSRLILETLEKAYPTM